MRAGIIAGFILCAALGGSPAEEQPVYSIDVNVVNVFATVRDPNGRLVTDLGSGDFVLEEDGVQQEVKYFASESDTPLTLGLLVDTSMSQRRVIRAERRASAQFFSQVLRPEIDRGFIIKFDFEVELLQDLTASTKDLRFAIDDLRVPRLATVWRGRGGRSWGGSVGTSMYDAIYLASQEIMSEVPGRKALILISDGVDLGSLMPLYAAIEYAQRADSIIYCVRYFDERGYFRAAPEAFASGPGKRGSNTMKRLTEETGGRFFSVDEELTLPQIFALIEHELRSQYSLGYTPPRGNNGFRQIKLRTKNKNLTVQTRAGYYPHPARRAQTGDRPN